MFGAEEPVLRLSTCNVEPHRYRADSGLRRRHRAGALPPHLRSLLHHKATPQAGEHKGTGLGLAVSYGIMQEHSGKIHVESQIGVGTTFQLEFPALGSRVTVNPDLPAASANSDKEFERKTLHV